MRRVINTTLSAFKYIIGIFMVYAGIATMFIPVEPVSRLGFIYESRVALVIFGIIFSLSGATLLYGKIRKKKRCIGYGLMAIYLCFTFATFLNWYAIGFHAAWGNAICSLIVGGLYLRWKYRIYYIEGLDKHSLVV